MPKGVSHFYFGKYLRCNKQGGRYLTTKLCSSCKYSKGAFIDEFGNGVVCSAKNVIAHECPYCGAVVEHENEFCYLCSNGIF